MMDLATLAIVWKQAGTQQLVILGTLGALILVALVLRHRSASRTNSGAKALRETDSAAETASMQRDLEQLLTELDGLSKKINAQLDDKLARVQQAIAEADARIATLRSLSAGAIIPTRISTGGSDSSGLIPQGSTAQAPATAGGLRREAESRHQAVYALADQGVPVIEIARRLGQRVGEIELILNLRAAERKAG